MALVGLLVSAMVASARGAPAAYADAAGQGGDFVRLASEGPLLDTRTGVGAPAGMRGPASTTTFPVLGQGAVPASGVSAVLVDTTLIAPTAATSLILWPDGAPRPAVSMLNANANQVLSNTAVVPVGANGRIAVHNRLGNTHLDVDVQGYFTSTSGSVGGGFVPVDYTRLVDTRTGVGTTAGSIPAGGSRTVTLTGGVVAAGAAAVFLDVAVVGSAAGRVSAYPAGSPNSRSILNHPAGTTSHGASVQLASTGQATFTNGGTAAIHLVLTAAGYFTANQAQGAGLRTIPATRLVDTRDDFGAPVPAGGTLDVQVGGTAGLPTRGIAGALLNFIAVEQTAGGQLTAWPLGAAESTLPRTIFPSGAGARGGLALVRLGTEATVRIRNVGTGTVHVVVDLQGWFADPLPAVPVTQFARASVRQLAPTGTATVGALGYAYVNNLGQVRYGHQPDPTAFGDVQWATVSGSGAFTGQPALTELPDRRVQVAAQHTDSNIRSVAWTPPAIPASTDWAFLGGSLASPPVPGRLADGTTVLFGVDADGRLWVYAQAGARPFWRSLGDEDLTGELTVVPLENGLRLVALGSGGAVKTAVYRDGGLSGWTSLGGSGMSGTPAAVVFPGSVVRVFVRGADGVLLTKMQAFSGAFPEAWSPLDGLVTAGSPAAILDPVYARTAVVARGADGQLHVRWETGQGTGAWGAWTPLGTGQVATDPTVAPYTYAAGQSWLAVSRNANDRVLYSLRAEPPAGASATSPLPANPFVHGSLPAAPESVQEPPG